MKQWFSKILSIPSVKTLLLPWAVGFIILNFANTQDGGPNAVSRFLTMRAMDEEATFQIDKRIGASADWAQTPDGHYYSNKAPGPMLLGFPTFFFIDQIPRIWEKAYRDENGYRTYPGYFQKTLTCLVNQIIPLLILMVLLLEWMRSKKLSKETQLFFILAVFYGSTISMYYNNYSGHAFEAILQLALLFSLLTGRYIWAGFFAGAAMLSDYGFGMQIPAFILAAILSMRMNKKKFFDWGAFGGILVGAIVPATLWIWYHISCYGSPFLIANHFQNPVFKDVVTEDVNLWGIFRLPNFAILWELLFGQSRGLLYTQPWILFMMPLILFRLIAMTNFSQRKELSRFKTTLGVYCVTSLAALLFMNMSFGAWNAGGAVGPRYLSGVFLCFALWCATELDDLPVPFRYLFWFSLGISIVFRGLVYGSTILGPTAPLWQWAIGEFQKTSKTPFLRFGIFWLVLVLCYLWYRKLSTKQKKLATA